MGHGFYDRCAKANRQGRTRKGAESAERITPPLAPYSSPAETGSGAQSERVDVIFSVDGSLLRSDRERVSA